MMPPFTPDLREYDPKTKARIEPFIDLAESGNDEMQRFVEVYRAWIVERIGKVLVKTPIDVNHHRWDHADSRTRPAILDGYVKKSLAVHKESVARERARQKS